MHASALLASDVWPLVGVRRRIAIIATRQQLPFSFSFSSSARRSSSQQVEPAS
jgi:hypothetical protein